VGKLVLAFRLSLGGNPRWAYWRTARRYFPLTTHGSLNQFLGFDVSVVPSSSPGTDGVTKDPWAVSQIASGQPHSSLVIPMTLGRGDAICLRLCTQGGVRLAAGVPGSRFRLR
jgi:hypothetical protein